MNANRTTFLALASEATGYSATDLEGTGLVDQYQALMEAVIGPAVSTRLYDTAKLVLRETSPKARSHAMKVDIVASPLLWPVVANLVQLWYLGQWSQLPPAWYAMAGLPAPKPGDPGATHVPSAQAYVEQLAYRAAGAHPPGAKPTGFGGWSEPPVFGDKLPPVAT